MLLFLFYTDYSFPISSPAVTSSLGSQTGMAYASRLSPVTPFSSRSRGNAQQELHTLSIAASVTRVKWRPMSSTVVKIPEATDLHEPMLAVATSSIKGASAGGAGQVSLWSWSRPFMPVCILEGHTEGAVPDFEWIDTPTPDAESPGNNKRANNVRAHQQGDSSQYDPSEQESDQGLNFWQHILSVGRDGRCLVQSFVRGKNCTHRWVPRARLFDSLLI